MFRLVNNKKGMALPTVLAIMVVIMILIFTLFNISFAESKNAIRQEYKTQAHYLGRSGVNLGLKLLEDKLPYDGDIVDLVDELNAMDTSISPVSVDTNEDFTLQYELINPKEIKVTSVGKVTGSRDITDKVTLRIKMLTSLLTGGKAEEWYVSTNSPNLIASNDPYAGGESYLGQGVFLQGKNNSATKLPSNAHGGTSIFQASVMELYKNTNNVSLMHSTNSQTAILDAEIIVFDGRVVLNTGINTILRISDTVAQNKINNDPESILYVDDSSARNAIEDHGDPNGVGFENEDYYNYFIDGTYAGHGSYPFVTSPYTRYGIVYFGEKLVFSSNEAQSAAKADRLPAPDTSIYEDGYFYFPDNISLNASTSELTNLLIPMRKDDPIVDLIEVMTKVTMSGKPFIWDNR